MDHVFKGFTPEWAGLHQGRISQQKGRETAHVMAARKQRDRMTLTTFRLLLFSLPAPLSYWLMLPHLGQGSPLSLVLSRTVLTNTPISMLSLSQHPLCGQADRPHDRHLCPASRVYYMVGVSSFHASLTPVYPKPVQRCLITIPLIRKVLQDCF